MLNTTYAKVLLGTFVLLISAFGVAYADHAWGKYHWDLSTVDTLANPLELGDNLSSSWQESLVGASSDWNNSVLKNQVAAGTSNANCDPTLGQVEVCNGAYGDNGWLGIAQIWVYRGKDGHIAQAIVKLNDTYFSLPAYDTSAWKDLVVCQEVGHTFGLGHQDENFTNANLGTCMDYTNDPDGSLYGQLNNEHPNQHDYDMLSSIYGHLNGTGDGTPGSGKGSGKGKPANVGTVTLNTPAEWGLAVAQDAQGRDSLYVRHLGSGVDVITHVLWAE
ncbi:hypothetical protein A2853_04085 [Candidatus Kaiserbacteria bacterium RIFCSPHIGHO2_01_FULL_55_17]|uniref:Peptidase M10 metallopeptidase domain-containing protein n=1 Tax=Candidatus Kaiserbacteria bacterium RIFCSPHIGHO2_01_FULL_55_17 TaxID=1798484 RepID=A0A1F6D8Q2_9BACT|nr:MAG: hypothetical protein A2853_04085 [Candidatus Kaiserbacteria bacterium RIFCSPHIGHO2_01_FULL_55_17]